MVEVDAYTETFGQSLIGRTSILLDGHGGAQVPSRRRHGRVTQRLTRDRGAAAVEFALVLPLFIAILFAIVHFGFVFFIWNDMGNAAREAARRLSVDDSISEAQAANVVQNWLAQWPATFSVTACKIADETSNSSDCTSANSVSVTVTAPMSEVSIIGPIAVNFGPAELRSSVIMRKEGIP